MLTATPTIAIQPASPANDQSNAFGAPTDRCGQTRPDDLAAAAKATGGDGSDIGPYGSNHPMATTR